jgi:hypothetical protein
LGLAATPFKPFLVSTANSVALVRPPPLAPRPPRPPRRSPVAAVRVGPPRPSAPAPLPPLFPPSRRAQEVKYLLAARKEPSLRGPQLLHSAAVLLGLGAFALEDLRPEVRRGRRSHQRRT